MWVGGGPNSRVGYIGVVGGCQGGWDIDTIFCLWLSISAAIIVVKYWGLVVWSCGLGGKGGNNWGYQITTRLRVGISCRLCSVCSKPFLKCWGSIFNAAWMPRLSLTLDGSETSFPILTTWKCG